MTLDILLHTPGWIWGLLAALIGLGLSQTRSREVSPVVVAALPVAMLGLSLVGVLTRFGHAPLPIAGWGVGLAAALGFARNAVAIRGARWSATTRRLRLPGSWWPLALILAIFAVKYAAGVAVALQPSLATEPAFAGGFPLACGFFSGLFLARALSLRAVVARPSALQPA